MITETESETAQVVGEVEANNWSSDLALGLGFFGLLGLLLGASRSRHVVQLSGWSARNIRKSKRIMIGLNAGINLSAMGMGWLLSTIGVEMPIWIGALGVAGSWYAMSQREHSGWGNYRRSKGISAIHILGSVAFQTSLINYLVPVAETADLSTGQSILAVLLVLLLLALMVGLLALSCYIACEAGVGLGILALASGTAFLFFSTKEAFAGIFIRGGEDPLVARKHANRVVGTVIGFVYAILLIMTLFSLF